jgi:hypothetical protein
MLDWCLSATPSVLIFEAPHIAALRYSKENSWKMWMFNFEKVRVTEGFDEWIALRKCMAPKMFDASVFVRLWRLTYLEAQLGEPQ